MPARQSNQVEVLSTTLLPPEQPARGQPSEGRYDEPLIADGFAAEAVAPALDVPDRGRGEVHRAAQGAGVAVALEKGAAGGRGLLLVVVDAHHEIWIASLDRRVDQIAG